MDEESLLISISAEDQLSAVYDGLVDKSSALDSALADTSEQGSGLGGVFSALAGPIGVASGLLAGVGAAAMATWADFDAGVDTIATMSGASGDSLTQLSDIMTALKGSSAGLGSSMEDIGTVLGVFDSKTDASNEGIQSLSDQVLKLAQLTGGDAATQAEAFSSIMNGWGLTAEETSGLMDTAFAASQQFGIGVDEITAALEKNGPAFRTMGFDVNESVGLLATFEKSGLDSGIMLKGLQTATADFAKEGKDVNEGLNDLIASISSATNEQDALALGVAGFGTKSGPAFVEAIRSGKLSLDDLSGALGNSKGAIDSTLAGTLDFSDQWSIQMSSMQTALIPVGAAINDLGVTVLPLLSQAMQGAISIGVSAVGELTTAWTNVQPVIAPVIDFISANIQPIMVGLAAALLAVVVPAFVAWATSAAAAAAATLAALLPIVAPIAAIGAAVTLLAVAWTNDFGGIRTTVTGWWNDILKPIFDQVLSWFQTEGPGALASLQATWDSTWAAIEAAIMPILTTVFVELSKFWIEIQPKLEEVWTEIQNLIATVMPIVQGVISTGIQFITDLWGAAWPAIQQVLSGVWEIIQGVVQVAWGVVSGIISAGLSLLSGDWQGAWDAIKGALDLIWQGIQDIVRGAWTALHGLIDLGLATLKTLWDTVWGAIGGKLTEIWDAIALAVNTKIAEVQLQITTITTAIGLVWSQFWDGVRTKAGEIWDAIVLAVTTKIAEVQAAFNGLASIGSNLVAGIQQGISDAWSGFMAFVHDKIMELPEAIRDFLGIHSPSTEGVEIGDYLMQGLQVGMQGAQADTLSTGRQLVTALTLVFWNAFDPQQETSVAFAWRTGWNAMFQFLIGTWQPVTLQWLKDFWPQAIDLVDDGGQGMSSAWAGHLTDMINATIAAVNTMLEQLARLPEGGVAPTGGGGYDGASGGGDGGDGGGGHSNVGASAFGPSRGGASTGGTHIYVTGPISIVASSEAGGRAAARGFREELLNPRDISQALADRSAQRRRL